MKFELMVFQKKKICGRGKLAILDPKLQCVLII